MPQPIIVFLYFNGIHHLFHTAMTAMELSILQDKYQIQLISSSPQNTFLLQKIKSYYPEAKCEIIFIKPSIKFTYLNFKRKNYPHPKKSMRKALKWLHNACAIVNTSHETVKQCQHLKVTKPILIYQYHGCGDRRYSFSPVIGTFDHVLVPGESYKERLIKENILMPEKISVIGYPKFDYVTKISSKDRHLFADDKPVILYTPHWDPRLNSYKSWGRNILDYFLNSKRYNLIFAPHIQLKHWHIAYGYDINLSKYKNSNIYIDLGSISSVDMSYLNIADIYLGDVSSQVYEFVALKRRPVVFLNAHHVNWRDNPDYYFWEMGPVVEKFDEFEEKLNSALHDESFYKIQEQRIRKYFAFSNIPSSLKAAQVILARIESNE